MKFPSLFGRTPSYHRFEYRPRYYDPAKEEREDRDRRIREELKLQHEKEQTQTSEDYRARIKGSFHKARRRSKPVEETQAVLIRLAALLGIAIFLIAFLTWGAPAIYGLLLVIPAWIYFRFLKK